MEVADAAIFEVTEQSQVSDNRRRIVRLCFDHGIDEKARDRLSLVCTELSTNLLKHTIGGGRLIAQLLRDQEELGVELYAIDGGAGMNSDECLADGVSSTGTMGTGLGAIKRLSDEFNVFSLLGTGTVVHSQVWNKKPKARLDFSAGGLTVPKHGEQLSGDKWAIVKRDTQVYCLLVDGLGHGIEASDAALLAKKRFYENIDKAPAAVIRAMHTGLRGSRGAVGAVARIDLSERRLDYCGLGNIAGIISYEDSSRHLVSMNGTLGYEAPKISEFTVPWITGSLLVMHSDGLSSKTGNAIAEVEEMPAPLIAGWLFQRHSKNTDDATVLAFKELVGR